MWRLIGGIPLTNPSQWTLGGVGQAVGTGAAGLRLLSNLAKKNSVRANQQQVSNVAGAAEVN
jgi:hypothetical protein